jgi:membrane associated rhomboid family serine protease
MGLADRDYYKQDAHHSRQPSNMTPVVLALLALNIGLYFFEILILDTAGRGIEKPMREFGAFAMESAFREHRYWEFITFQFLHGSLAHLAFNSLAIFFFGPWMERWWGSLRFLAFYLLCGAAGALFFSALVILRLLPCDWQSGLVGASAGIYGILIGVAVIAPNLRVRLLFPPVELSMRQLASIILGIATVVILLGIGDNEGGEAGHLGGAILGFILTRHPWLLGRSGKGSPLQITRPQSQKTTSEPKLRPRSNIDLQRSSEVDRILDKISSQGFQTLTPSERETLQRAAQSEPDDR